MFSVPVLSENSSNSSTSLTPRKEDPNQVEMTVLNDYIFDEAEGILHYQGTKARLTAEERMPSSQRGTLKSRQTRNYSIVIQATTLSSPSTIAGESCVSSLIKWHINRASEQNRFRCAPVDNRGSWKVGLHVNINVGRGNYAQYGSCCF